MGAVALVNYHLPVINSGQPMIHSDYAVKYFNRSHNWVHGFTSGFDGICGYPYNKSAQAGYNLGRIFRDRLNPKRFDIVRKIFIEGNNEL